MTDPYAMRSLHGTTSQQATSQQADRNAGYGHMQYAQTCRCLRMVLMMFQAHRQHAAANQPMPEFVIKV